ncbi:MAG TPA: BolA family protein [Burkholderiales bacterium]|nr:BolA family protein [Burkholderiales bacterium]
MAKDAEVAAREEDVASSNIIAAMRERLAALAPDLVEIFDESAAHAGHEGAKGGGGHYRLLIVARAFESASRVARHRMVYAALGALLRREIHALAISAVTPEELAPREEPGPPETRSPAGRSNRTIR